MTIFLKRKRKDLILKYLFDHQNVGRLNRDSGHSWSNRVSVGIICGSSPIIAMFRRVHQLFLLIVLVRDVCGESFDLHFYDVADVNASSCSAASPIVTTLELGCQTAFGDVVQFDCTENHELRLTIGYSDSACEQEAASGYTFSTIDRECQAVVSGTSIFELLSDDPDISKIGRSTLGYTILPKSPCLTPFEEWEQQLGMELLDIFGLNNVTNATDPVLYEVKETLFSYGVVFVAAMCLLGFLLCIVGYKFFWLTLFSGGFAVLGYLGYFAWMQVCTHPWHWFTRPCLLFCCLLSILLLLLSR